MWSAATCSMFTRRTRGGSVLGICRVCRIRTDTWRPCCRYKASGRIVAPEVQQVPDMEVSDEEVNHPFALSARL
jgi:hypothetical protein